MFRKLRLKLMLINIGLVVLITLFFMGGIRFLMDWGIRSQSEQLMRLVAADIDSKDKNLVAVREKGLFNYFYVKIDQSGNITETSPSPPVSRPQLKELVSKTMEMPKEQGRVKISGKYHDFYLFQKAPLKNDPGQTLVFMDPKPQDEISRHLLRAFALTSLGGIVLTLLGSIFMANRALVPIKKSWERQKNFIADASHELRTPLTVIQTNLDVVKSSPSETVESQKVWLENIAVESKLMAKLVDDLLFLARVDSAQELLKKDTFLLNLALNQVIQAFEPVAARERIKLNSRVIPQIDLYGDQTRIKQLVSILIDNAIKYTPSGGEVNLEVKNLENKVEIIISDTGEGIEQEHLNKIFERFYRVDKARSREDGGIGLGLSIADSIVKAHKGTIKIQSAPDKGSTFIISLPKQKGVQH